ncbi:class I SAM-dependent methyltransferase [Saccharibacillus alkalitolerans]|uniref:Class I SAM-dependent methyltransferase n=1 Tax=Saccharibacillus alkalitolerans TaxID=2705290 RepID=A0ABX0F6N3_9BACL|nr:class I SAM-dependent methyltransferase [Saccharibacillus alkalitolerans]NGZ76626.1 class I SAM-dependent methyltransferase [Saccharibacillus alkalitolerans]
MSRSDQRYWNAAYSDPSFSADHDGWLERYLPLLHPSKGTVVDLGCGLGHNARALAAKGFDVLACDLSEKALARLRREEPGIGTLRLDMAEGLPFADGSLQAVVADLSLHYFPGNVTRRIVGDIRRALAPDGLLLCRLNAISEMDGGRDRAVSDDPYLFASEGILRRFFDEGEIAKFFPDADWETLERREYESGRYGKTKTLWETGLRKISREKGERHENG